MPMNKLCGASGFVLAVALSLVVPESRAQAADLGGDCCADLEGRIASLEATTVTTGNRKVSLEISGRVDANVMGWSEHASGPTASPLDQTHGVYFGNAAPDTRDPNIVFSGSGKVSRDLMAGFSMQIDYVFSGADTQTSYQGPLVPKTDTTYVFLKSAALGEVRLGNMFTAADDAYYLNFGGGTVGGVSGANHTGSFFLRDIHGTLTDTTYLSVLGEISDNQENLVMYVSPTVSGFTFKASAGGDESQAASLTWIGKVRTVEIEAGVGVQVAREGDGDCAAKGAQCTQGFDVLSQVNAWSNGARSTLRSFGGSASIWDTASGLYASGEWSQVQADIAGRQDPSNWFAQAGWLKNATGIGNTTLYASYDRTLDKAANNTAAHYWNVGLDQAIDAVAANLYLHYQHDAFDTDGVTGGSTGAAINSQAIDSVTGGMVIHF